MKNNVEMKEKRRYIRTDTSMLMVLRLKEGDSLREIKSVTRNISATGMMIEVENELPVGTQIQIDLTAPESVNPVHCVGKVIWSAPLAGGGKYTNGVEFTNIEEDNKNTFLKFLCDVIYKASGKAS